MKFNCTSCGTHLIAEDDSAGMTVRCPGCNARLLIPEPPVSSPGQQNWDTNAYGNGGDDNAGANRRELKNREAWKEKDPANPNALLSCGVGFGLTIIWFTFIYFFQAPAGKPAADFTFMQRTADLFFKHFAAGFANTLFFCWAMTICYLKFNIQKHQRRAMFLDVLPMEVGKEINLQNVGRFIDHVYSLPLNLRDSLMVNRIRKALEFFEVRPNVTDVSAMMTSQSAIDGARITSSYIIVRAFLWAIPLIGFIGTVVGLSHAISGMSFNNVEDVSKIVGSINNVTSGLGTAFDATLLGLVFAVILNFPINALAKHEEETLNDIDAFCNEVLLPRLNDVNGSNQDKDLGHIGKEITNAIAATQREFLADLNTLSGKMLDYSENLDNRIQEHHQQVAGEFAANMESLRNQTNEFAKIIENNLNLHNQRSEAKEQLIMQDFATNMNAMLKQVKDFSKQVQESGVEINRQTIENQKNVTSEFVKSLAAQQEQQKTVTNEFVKSLSTQQEQLSKVLSEPVRQTAQYFGSLQTGLQNLNDILKKLGGETIVIQSAKRKWWFSRE